MSSLRSFIAIATLLTAVIAQKDNGDECSCFVTNDTSSGYFQYHRFHDFRNVSSSDTPPALDTDEGTTSSAYATSDFFTGESWVNDWTIQSWNNSDGSSLQNNATVLMVNSPNNVYIEQSNDSSPDYDSYLTLRTARLDDFQSVAEFDSNERNFEHLSARFLARVTGSPGACAGMFTYRPPPTNKPNAVQEIDIEILTNGPNNVVQFTNQPSTDKHGNSIPDSTVNGSLPSGDWGEWNVYRLDWMPKKTSWYVNGISIANVTHQVPKDPSGLFVNMWSDGGEWTGVMDAGNEAVLQIQWIEMVFNVSGEYSGYQKRDSIGSHGTLEKRKKHHGCAVVCSIDDVVDSGTPVMLYNNTGTAANWKEEGMGMLMLVPLVFIGGFVFGLL